MDLKEYEKALELTQKVMEGISDRKFEDDRRNRRKEKVLYFSLVVNLIMTIFFTFVVGFFIYFISNFNFESNAVKETVTIEGTDAQYNSIKGNNNSINTGGADSWGK
ncbi:MAG: hypothetical protein MSA56_15135 [Clostridium sp.]|nr:hypothetical protein [Clostridium sp.]